MSIDLGFSTIIASVFSALIAAFSSIICAYFSKKTSASVANISNNISNHVKVDTHNPVNVHTPNIEIPPLEITSNTSSDFNVVFNSMQNIITNLYLIIYNTHIEEAELELIKNCSIINLYLDNDCHDIKEYCKIFCEHISSDSTSNLQDILSSSLEHFTFLCRQYILQNTQKS